MKIDTYFKISNLILFILIIFLLSEAFHHFFGFHLNRYYPDIYPFSCHYKLDFHEYSQCILERNFHQDIWLENGLVELLQLFLLMFSIIIIIINLFRIEFNNKKIFKFFLILQVLGLIYIFFEEMSWGQHFLNFKTPEILGNINHQNEVNLHNISNLFNELPRSLVLIWCSLCGFSIFFLKNKISSNLITIIKPSNKILYISFLLIIFTIPNLIVDKFDLINWAHLHINYRGNNFMHKVHMINSPLIREGYNYKHFLMVVFSSNYYKFSEFQELIFYYYFLWHTNYLIFKIKDNLK